MGFPEDQVDELKAVCQEVRQAVEAGLPYFLLPNFALPDACAPNNTDLLLCAAPRDGYSSRLFFGQQVSGRKSLNWNAQGTRILERNWWAYSWKTREDLRLAQMLAAHLDALR